MEIEVLGFVGSRLWWDYLKLKPVGCFGLVDDGQMREF
jgi:hypothetical protein